MELDNKEIYRQFAEQEQLPLFMQPWWLDAVTAPDGKQWDVLLAYNRQGEAEAAMPYMLRQRMGFRYVLMPQQTQIGGVGLSGKIKNDSHAQENIVKWLIEQLGKLRLDYYYQQYSVDSPIPALLAARGFTTRERVTYRIERPANIDAVVRSFSYNKRRQLKKAASLVVDFDLTPQEFYAFHSDCLKEKHQTIRYSWELFKNIYQYSTARNQGQVIALRSDTDSRLVAAAFVVWDEQQMYYLIPVLLSSAGRSGAGTRIAFECIKLAQKKGIAFDFEGSNIPSVANHYRQFGSTPVKYYSVEKKTNPLFSLLLYCNRVKEKWQRK